VAECGRYLGWGERLCIASVGELKGNFLLGGCGYALAGCLQSISFMGRGYNNKEEISVLSP
jgi:hypothetical protein